MRTDVCLGSIMLSRGPSSSSNIWSRSTPKSPSTAGESGQWRSDVIIYEFEDPSTTTECRSRLFGRLGDRVGPVVRGEAQSNVHAASSMLNKETCSAGLAFQTSLDNSIFHAKTHRTCKDVLLRTCNQYKSSRSTPKHIKSLAYPPINLSFWPLLIFHDVSLHSENLVSQICTELSQAFFSHRLWSAV